MYSQFMMHGQKYIKLLKLELQMTCLRDSSILNL